MHHARGVTLRHFTIFRVLGNRDLRFVLDQAFMSAQLPESAPTISARGSTPGSEPVLGTTSEQRPRRRRHRFSLTDELPQELVARLQAAFASGAYTHTRNHNHRCQTPDISVFLQGARWLRCLPPWIESFSHYKILVRGADRRHAASPKLQALGSVM